MKLKELIEAGIISMFAIFAPIQSTLVTVVVLIAIDLVTGLMASRKQGQPITSAALRRTITKTAVYEVTVMVAFITEKYLVPGMFPLVKMASAMIAMTELRSIYENLNIISGQNLLSSLISKIGSDNDNLLNNKQDKR